MFRPVTATGEVGTIVSYGLVAVGELLGSHQKFQ